MPLFSRRKRILNMTFAERIKSARKQAGLTQKSLAECVNISQTAIHKLEAGNSSSSRRTVDIALACGVDPVWLHTGKGNMDASGLRAEKTIPTGAIPLISWPEAKESCNQEGDSLVPVLENILFWIPVAAKYGDRIFSLRVSDDSMEPEFAEGDVIVVDPTLEAEHNGYVVALMDSGMPTFKQLIIMGNKMYLKPLNQRYPLLEIQGELLICGVVVSKYKSYL